ncbi:BTB/POZ domain protein [Rhizoctonia solani 123E]|uniref:BTB/POZ domain protein n=1 Tax=Rhizoctonia solani 123E TaxID=1423351 RepID=A0A074T0K8_9AGAM|nr:BTB/POZ domain protein [Rhizoctonia solani 123E]
MNGTQEVSHAPAAHGSNGISNQAGPSNIYASPAPSSPTDPSRTQAAVYTAPELTAEQVNQRHAEISAHIYHTGFQLGQYADVSLHVHNRQYRLHALILSRSPYLAHLLATSQNNVIYIRLDDEPHITEEAIAVALGYLYSPYQVGLVNPSNARSVVAAASLLGGMPELADLAFECCRASISANTIVDWVNFVESMPPPPASDATPTNYPQGQTSVFGPYLTQFRDLVYGCLIVTLPNVLHAFTVPEDGNGWDELLAIYTPLPFDTLKQALESPAFPAGTDQVRFRFAKAVVAQRKQANPTGAEETVVLAFGGSQSGSAVHITRKSKKKQLWKVGGR